jgi:hypothetical protein
LAEQANDKPIQIKPMVLVYREPGDFVMGLKTERNVPHIGVLMAAEILRQLYPVAFEIDDERDVLHKGLVLPQFKDLTVPAAWECIMIEFTRVGPEMTFPCARPAAGFILEASMYLNAAGTFEYQMEMSAMMQRQMQQQAQQQAALQAILSSGGGMKPPDEAARIALARR